MVGGPQDAQPLHRDVSHHTPAVLLGPDCDDVHITFIVAFSPFTEANGATRVIPGSHKWPFHQRGLPSMTIPAVMDAGDCILMCGKVVHGTGANLTTTDRHAVQMSICAGYFTPADANSHIVSVKIAKLLSKRAQRFLGFRSQWTRGSPGLWAKDYQDLSVYLGLDNLEGFLEDLKEVEFDYESQVESGLGKSRYLDGQ
ncbi:putative verruculogen synthase [Microsporum ferrugineum]